MKLRPITIPSLTGAAVAFLIGLPGSIAGQTATTPPPGSKPAVAAEAVHLPAGAQEILKLSHAKVDEEVTLAFIRHLDRRFELTASDIVYLRQEGVSDRILAAMLTHRPEAPAAAPAAMETAATAPAPVASAPQYTVPPVAPAVDEAAPASTVYVTAATPASYYSFYDPWPYWYTSWPYYWYWYPYAWCSFGWYWGDCHYDHWDHYCGDDHHSGHHDGHDGHHDGNPPPSGGNPPPPDGRQSAGRTPPVRGGASDTGGLAAGSRPSADVSPSAASVNSRSLATRSPRVSPAERNPADRLAPGAKSDVAPSSAPAKPGDVRSAANGRAVPSRSGGVQSPTISPTGSQNARPTSTWLAGADARTVAARSPESPAVGPTSRGYSTRSTTTWSGGVNSGPSVRPSASQGPVAVSPSVRFNSAPTTTWSQPGTPTMNRYVARPSVNYQRSSAAPVYSPRSSGNFSSYSRSSMTAPSRSVGGASAFRSGGSYGGSSSRPSMSAGGFSRGGGMGGMSGGRSR